MSLHSLIFHNFWLKLFSLILAGSIWWVIWFERQSEGDLRRSVIATRLEEQALRVPVSITTQPGDARVFKVHPEEVMLVLIAESAVLKELSPRSVQAYVDLRNVTTSGSFEELVKVNVPESVTLSRVVPRVATIEQVSP